MSETRFGTFEDLLAQAPPERRPVALRLREIVLEVDPEAAEVVRLGWNSAAYAIGPKDMNEVYAYIMPRKGWINLGFYRGAHLPDPAGLLEGTGKNLRHIKIRSIEDTERPGVRALLAAALAERREVLGR